MTATPTQTIQTLRDNNHLSAFARQLHQVLSEKMGLPEPFSESRARAILRAANLLDEATQASFQRLVQKESNLRLALHALLVNTAVEVTFTPPYPNEAQEIPWLALALVAFAHKNGYPVGNLNPSAPPAPHSPAGLLLQQVGGFFRHETQRTATERDRQARDLAYAGRAADEAQNASGFSAPIAPVPPYFRSPVPVRYPEFNEPVAVDDEEVASETPSVPTAPQPQTHLTITPEETVPSAPPPQRMPGIRITHEQVTPPPVRIVGESVSVPRPSAPNSIDPVRTAGTNLLDNIRNLFKGEEFSATKLRVLVQEYPDGPGLYGLQVKVTCKGVRSHVAGTTDRQGRFTCELPVRETSGLTYDVDVVWPREAGGETEQKSITLSADREVFEMPFYRKLSAT